MNSGTLVTRWVIDTVKKHYADDIALIISHTTLRIEDQTPAVGYFVPLTERGYQFGRTFILNGEGFDIWAVDWARLERFADLEEYNLTCLADGEILYARTPADADRFAALQKRQAANLSDRVQMRKCALTAYAQAKSVYLEMLFAQTCSDVRMCAGYILDYLAQAVAFSNLRYFHKSQTAQLEELAGMDNVPDGFADLYLRTIAQADPEAQKALCRQAIGMVQRFLEAQPHPAARSAQAPHADYQMLADWYAELSYTWLRIRHYAKENDAVKVYMWAIMLQQELNRVCDAYGLDRMPLMEHYSADNLTGFARYADQLEAAMRAIITEGGGTIHAYDSFEEFLHEV